MMFMLWHVLAISSVIVISFIAGFWYANNSYVRQRKTTDALRVVDDFADWNKHRNKSQY